MRKYILCLLLLVQMLPANAAITLEALAKYTGSPEKLTGDFKQDKYIQAFETHVLSSGHFKYLRDQSIHWNTDKPVANQMVMTPDKIASKQGDHELVVISVEANHLAKVLNQVFFAVLTAEWQTLDQFFDQRLQGKLEDWRVVLTPKSDDLKQVVTQVELAGGKFLTKVVLHEKSGDKTYLYFSNITQ